MYMIMSSRQNLSLVTKINNILADEDVAEETIDLLHTAIDEYVAELEINVEPEPDPEMPALVAVPNPDEEEDVPDGEHICETCGMECNSVIELLDHNMIYHEGVWDQFGCDVCNFWAKTNDELSEHYKITHGETGSDSEEELVQVAEDGKVDSENEQDAKSEDSEAESDSDKSYVVPEPKAEEVKSRILKISIPPLEDEDVENLDIKKTDKLRRTRMNFNRLKSKLRRQISPVPERAPRNVHHVEDGKFACPVCELKFNTPYHLGEHFSFAHQSYEIQKDLDTKTSIYFPGYDMLHMINMIDFLDNSQLEKIKTESCPICRTEYTTRIIKRTKSCTQFDRLKYSPDKTSFQKIEDAIKTTYADTQTSVFDHCYPLFMTCCKNHICHSCLKSHIMATYDITCPFCTKDHTREDLTYVTELKPGMFNKSTWQTWWTKHLDIMY